MSPATLLFLVVVGIYLLDCIVLVPENALVLSERNAGGWMVQRAGVALGALRKRAVLAGALAPGRATSVLPHWPLAMSPQGIAWRDTADVVHGLSYGALTMLQSDGQVLHLTESDALRVYSASRARHLVSVLVKLRDARSSARASIIDAELSRAMDSDAAKLQWSEYRRASIPLRAVSILLFVHLFIGWPFAIRWVGPNQLWPFILAELFVLVAITLWQFVRMHRRVFAGTPIDVAQLVSLALSPPAAVRAMTTIARDLFGAFHPAAVAGALCSPAEFKVLASQMVRDLKYPVERGTSAVDARSVDAWFTEQQVAAMTALASRLLNGEPLPNAPIQESERSCGFCPCCWSQYDHADGACDDCGGMALKRFS
jgi:hypothetical protein